MSLGTILTSVAGLVLLAAYVARPFRRERVDGDLVVDKWVRQLRTTAVEVDDGSEAEGAVADISTSSETDLSGGQAWADAGADAIGVVTAEAIDDEPVNFCPYCGRRVERDHVFCPKCGRQLAEGDA